MRVRFLPPLPFNDNSTEVRMSKEKKAEQLGMNPSTASGRLLKDLLFKFAIDAGHVCYQCGEELTRDTFSIEHIEPWLDSEDPKGLFFDLSNIAFSHLKCNVSAGRRNRLSDEEKKARQKVHNENWHKSNYTPEYRRERYLKEGR